MWKNPKLLWNNPQLSGNLKRETWKKARSSGQSSTQPFLKRKPFRLVVFSLQVGCVDSLLKIDIPPVKKRAQKLRFFWGFFLVGLEFFSPLLPAVFLPPLVGFRTVFDYCGWDKNSPWISCWVPHDGPRLTGTPVRFHRWLGWQKLNLFPNNCHLVAVSGLLLLLRKICFDFPTWSFFKISPEKFLYRLTFGKGKGLPVPSFFSGLFVKLQGFFSVTFWDYGSLIHNPSLGFGPCCWWLVQKSGNNHLECNKVPL